MALVPWVTWEFSRGYPAELLKRSGYDHKNPAPYRQRRQHSRYAGQGAGLT